MNVLELVVAGVLTLFGVRSLLRWMGREFEAGSPSELFVYLLHVTARVGMWFALAGFFVGYAVVDEPQTLGWYLLLLIALASLQLLTSFYLWRSPAGPGEGRRDATRPGGKG